MRHVTLGRTGLDASVLGFGCSSLGSRVDAATGLRALAAARDRGVEWFDVAPAYGRGAAEGLLGEFLKGRRDGLRICTKVGLAPPANTEGLKGRVLGIAMPLARRMVGALPGLRGAIRRTGTQSNRKLPLTGDLVRRSIDESLRRLGTDHVDLYGLHNATPEEIAREELLRALEDLRAAGKALAVSVCGGPDVALAAATGSEVFGAVQLAVPAPGEMRPAHATGGEAQALKAARDAGLGTITHSVFGGQDMLQILSARLDADAGSRAALVSAAGGEEPKAALARLLVRRGLTLNPDGVMLVSMFSDRSLTANLAALEEGPADAATLALLDRLAAG